MSSLAIKTFGYLISSLSVVLLGAVAWDGAAEKPPLLACLIGGMLASIAGMACRWLSYFKDHKAQAQRRSSAGTRTAA